MAAVYDDLLASTLADYKDQLFEQWYKNNRIAKKMFEAGSIVKIDGGRKIEREVNLRSGGTVGVITSSSAINISQAQARYPATWEWTGIGGSVVMSDWDRAKNTGKHQLVDLFASRLEDVRQEMDQKFSELILSSSTADANTMWSLLDVVDSADPSIGAFGGLSRLDYSVWQAYEVGSVGSFATAGLDALRLAFNTTSREGSDPVSFFITTEAVERYYRATLTNFEQIVPTANGDLEFDAVAFSRKPMYFADQMPTGTLLGINAKHTKLAVNTRMMFDRTPFVRQQDGQTEASLIRLMCNLICTRPASNLKLTGITA